MRASSARPSSLRASPPRARCLCRRANPRAPKYLLTARARILISSRKRATCAQSLQNSQSRWICFVLKRSQRRGWRRRHLQLQQLPEHELRHHHWTRLVRALTLSRPALTTRVAWQLQLCPTTPRAPPTKARAARASSAAQSMCLLATASATSRTACVTPSAAPILCTDALAAGLHAAERTWQRVHDRQPELRGQRRARDVQRRAHAVSARAAAQLRSSPTI